MDNKFLCLFHGDNIMTSAHLVLHNSLVLLAFNHAVVKEASFMDDIDKCFQSSVVSAEDKNFTV